MHGCAKNQVDAELITNKLQTMGWTLVDDAEYAHLIIVNTCGFIQPAKEESINAVIDAKTNYPDAKILMSGCLAERYAEDFLSELVEVDGFFGNGDLSKIEEIITDIEKDIRSIVKPPQRGVCEGSRTILADYPASAYIKITEGCDNYCSFCAIPLIRGRLRSRSIEAIVEEIKLLQSQGYFEFNLIGQDLAAYGKENFTEVQQNSFDWEDIGKSPLSQMLEAIAELDGHFWVRLLYIHPDHFPRDILPIIKNDPRFLPYFDIPFQSGDNGTIQSMNRRGSTALYTKLLDDIKEVLPDASFRTTFLCGFPGETDTAFENTKQFLKAIKPSWSGCFAYSREENTASYIFKNRVPAKVAQKRSQTLQLLQAEISEQRLHEHIGKTYDVLVEELIQGEDVALGRAWFQAPEIDGACVICYDRDFDKIENIFPGALIKIHITSVRGVDIVGNYVGA